MARHRCAHFKLQATSGNHRFDGKTLATVTIEYHGPTLAFIRVRPWKRRKAAELTLHDVARGILFDVAKREVAERKAAKKAARRAR